MERNYEYDVALSFAGEQRTYVEQVASALRERGVRVFYDEYEKANLWGKDLYEHLDYVYQKAARYCVVFASAEYAKKMWTSHERRSAQARAIEENAEYILPARFDDTEIPGIRRTVGYIDASSTLPVELASLIAQKLGPVQRTRYLPPVMDRLYEALGVERTPDEEYVAATATAFYFALDRMSPEERSLLLDAFVHGCPSDLPENVHISLDLLRRITGLASTEILQILHGMRSLGLYVSEYSGSDHNDGDLIELRWHDHRIYDDPEQDHFSLARSTEVARAVLETAVDGMCEEHSRELLRHLDLANLSSATARDHAHLHDGDGDGPDE